MPPLEHSLKIAVVGAGDMGRRQIRAVAAEPRCELAAVVDPSPDVGALSVAFGSPVFSDFESMCARVHPDGVIIATPNALHVALALQCVDRRVPVLVEKPIADTVDDALELADRSEATAVPVLVGHHRRHNPIIHRARELLEDGLLGDVTSLSATWLVRKPDAYYTANWRTRPGGGPILINLIHDIDSIRYLVGEITAVQAVVANARRAFAVEDSAAVLLKFENGAIGTIALSDATPSPWSWELTSGETTSYTYPQTGEDCYRLAGTLGSLALPSLRLWRYPAEPDWTEALVMEHHPVAPADPLARQLRHFIDVLRGKAQPLVGARDAAQTLAVTLAVSEAARRGTEVRL